VNYNNIESKKLKYLNSRRKFISNVGKIAVVTTSINSLPFLKKSFANVKLNGITLPDFPMGIEVSQQRYKNWSCEIDVKSVWTCLPKTASDIVMVVNWAYKTNYKVRPKGKMHNWAPFTVANGLDPSSKVLLIDMVSFLTKISIDKSLTPNTVTAQTGITMDSLLAQLEGNGLGFTSTPAAGDISLGGVLAINGHGAAVSPSDENNIIPGQSYGSLSNLILSLTAIVWDYETNQYILKTFERSNSQCKAFLVHLGRAFIVEATLQVVQNQRLRCQSIIGIPVSELFGLSNSSPYNFSNFIDKTGRVEAILFPFTEKPWLKVWSTTEEKKPDFSKLVESPYNYPFSDNISEKTFNFIESIISGNLSVTPAFGKFEYFVTSVGLQYNNAFDLWGWSKNLLLYIKPTTLRMAENGYVVITKRENIQRVINEFYSQYCLLINKYSAQNRYPINGPIEIRVTGLDNSKDIINTAADSPLLSALKRSSDNYDWDVGIWIDILTIPGTPYSNQFYQEIEEWFFSNYIGTYATVRVEWSKRWAFTDISAWANSVMIEKIIPNSLRSSESLNDDWEKARSILNFYDPHRIFTSPLHDSLKL
jgi:FAD/FMN-containing dehydrogenase